MQKALVFLVSGIGMLFFVTVAGRAAETATRRPQAVDLAAIQELDLKTAGQIALQDNPSLSAALARVTQAKERIAEAQAGYWPTVGATANASQVTLSNNAYQERLATAQLFNPNATVKDPDEYYEASLVANWVLFNGFERKFANAAASYGHEQSQAAYQDASRLLLSSVATAYLRAQLALEDIAIAKADEEFNRRQLKDAQTRHRTGTGSLSDVYNFEIRVNSAITVGTVGQQSYDAAMIGLASLLGIPQGIFPDHIRLAPLEAESPEEQSEPDADALIAYAQEHRSDILQSDLAVKQADAQVKALRGRFFPVVSVEAAFDGERAGDSGMAGDDFGNTVGINLTYNFFSGGADMARWRQAKAGLTESEKTLESVKIAAKSEIRTSLSALKSAHRQLVLQRSNVRLVEQTRNLVEKEYAAGVASLVRLNEAQRDLTTAQNRLALALAALHQAWYNLQTDTGHILEAFMADNAP